RRWPANLPSAIRIARSAGSALSFSREPSREPVTSTHPAAHPELDRAAHHASVWLEGLTTRAVNATTSLEELRTRLRVPLTDEGIDPVQVVDDLAAATEGGLLGSPGGRFFAWVIGGTMPAAIGADWLTS